MGQMDAVMQSNLVIRSVALKYGAHPVTNGDDASHLQRFRDWKPSLKVGGLVQSARRQKN